MPLHDPPNLSPPIHVRIFPVIQWQASRSGMEPTAVTVPCPSRFPPCGQVLCMLPSAVNALLRTALCPVLSHQQQASTALYCTAHRVHTDVSALAVQLLRKQCCPSSALKAAAARQHIVVNIWGAVNLRFLFVRNSVTQPNSSIQFCTRVAP